MFTVGGLLFSSLSLLNSQGEECMDGREIDSSWEYFTVLVLTLICQKLTSQSMRVIKFLYIYIGSRGSTPVGSWEYFTIYKLTYLTYIHIQNNKKLLRLYCVLLICCTSLDTHLSKVFDRKKGARH
jgi:hypothetical protein